MVRGMAVMENILLPGSVRDENVLEEQFPVGALEARNWRPESRFLDAKATAAAAVDWIAPNATRVRPSSLILGEGVIGERMV